MKRNLPLPKKFAALLHGRQEGPLTTQLVGHQKRRGGRNRSYTRARGKKTGEKSHTRNTAVRFEVTEGRGDCAIIRPIYERAAATAFCAAGEIFLPSLLKRTRTGGARLRRPTRERTRTTWAWIAHEMQ